MIFAPSCSARIGPVIRALNHAMIAAPTRSTTMRSMSAERFKRSTFASAASLGSSRITAQPRPRTGAYVLRTGPSLPPRFSFGGLASPPRRVDQEFADLVQSPQIEFLRYERGVAV